MTRCRLWPSLECLPRLWRYSMDELAELIETPLPPIAPAGDDRRASLRRPTFPREVVYFEIGDPSEGKLARLVDVSSLGVGLLLPKPPKPSALLRFHLGPSGRDVLARVVHITPEEGGYLVGCALVRELHGPALGPLQIPGERATAEDRRRWVRYPCDVEAVCWSLDTTPGERSSARILDVSAGGLGLLLPCEFGPGTLLLLKLGTAMSDTFQLLLRVVRCIPVSRGFLLGCEFADRLAVEELEPLL